MKLSYGTLKEADDQFRLTITFSLPNGSKVFYSDFIFKTELEARQALKSFYDEIHNKSKLIIEQ